MKRLRPATPEEVDSIKATSDLDPTCAVLALDTQAGILLAVLRTPVEVDPVHFPPETSDKLKMIFIRDIETYLSAKGVLKYYFNIHADDENAQYRSVMEHMGAVQTSTQPEVRFKKEL